MMEKIIDDMINTAYQNNNYEMAEYTYQIICMFAITINCPSNWRDIGKMMAEKYKNNYWIMEYCKLYVFG